MKLVRQQNDFLHDVVKLLQFCWKRNYLVTGGELWRTMDQQGLYYARGKTTTLHSLHCRRLAIDLNFFRDNLWVNEKSELQEVGDYWESLNKRNKWGGNWQSFIDVSHFQRSEEI